MIHGFQINPFGEYVENKTINGKQCIIAFYVDDNKIGHKDLKDITANIDLRKEQFGDFVVYKGKGEPFLRYELQY